jgi:hypothetical protein
VPTNKRERWELFDVDAGTLTQLPAPATATANLPNPTTRQQPGLKIAGSHTKTSTSKDKFKILLPEGTDLSAISAVQAAG